MSSNHRIGLSAILLALLAVNSYGRPAPPRPHLPILNIQAMQTPDQSNNDSLALSAINARFIRNFITQDAKAHALIIHPDFVCIESNGSIVDRATYLRNWATDYEKSGYTSFTYVDESIRIFGNVALVRSKTICTSQVNGKKVEGYTIYTDTYLKENGQWKCIQVQITPVK